MGTQESFDELLKLVKTAEGLDHVGYIVDFDMYTRVPKAVKEWQVKAAQAVTEAQSFIWQSSQMEDLVSELRDVTDLTEYQARTMRELTFQYDRKSKVPSDLDSAITAHSKKAESAWEEAAEKNDFSLVQGPLQEMFRLQREKAFAINSDADPYETLYQDFDPGMDLSFVHANLGAVRDALVPLLDKIKGKPQIDDSFLRREVSHDAQKKFLQEVIMPLTGLPGDERFMNFHKDYNFSQAIRFCVQLEKNWMNGILSTWHEAGHTLYDYNIPLEQFGTPLGRYRGMSVHESQSRILENQVGRSRSMLEFLYPQLQEAYGDALEGITLDAFQQGIGKIGPHPIRLQSDQLTYNLHIIMRFELAHALINNELEVANLPEAWDEKLDAYLGLTPKNLKEGCLQDAHWTMSDGVGYFPTYLLGSMMAAQIYAAAEKDNPRMQLEFSSGNTASLTNFTRENIHVHGSQYTIVELLEHATGEAPNPQAYISYLTQQATDTYNL